MKNSICLSLAMLVVLVSCKEDSKDVTSKNKNIRYDKNIAQNDEVKSTNINDTLNIMNNEFVMNSIFSTLDYFVVNKQNTLIDTLSYSFQKNHTSNKQVDTIIRIKPNKLDTLDYYLGYKSILTDAKIYSDNFIFNDSIKVGCDFEKVVLNLFENDTIDYHKTILVYDFEGFNNVFLTFKNERLYKLKFDLEYLE